ncbi:cholesterol 7-desaturase nvd [Ixodes scapularis]
MVPGVRLRLLGLSTKRYPRQDLIPVFPNGWIPVLESSELGKEDVKRIDLLGLELVAFRTRDGVACVADAYCPHLGAHLGAVGRVVGDCIECPYHGWRFSGTTGACTHAPFAPKVPEYVTLKKWEVHEVLGFVFVWHHAEGEEPSWRIEDIPQITKGDWKLFFRYEDRVSCHIHDLIENAFDTAHVKHLHKPNSLLSPNAFIQSGGDTLWARFTMNHWTVKNRIEAHRCINEFDAQVSILGKRWPVLRTIAETQNIGPALIVEHARSKFGTARAVIAILPEEPLQMRVIQRMHFEPDAWWFFRYFLSKAHISQFRRDISIMNTKTLIEHPPLQPMDMKILEFRKWFSQFLSENSPTWQTVRERTLQW